MCCVFPHCSFDAGYPVNYALTLDLLGVGWNKSEVTVGILDSEDITEDAIEDIEEAIDDWNAVLMELNAAPDTRCG